VRECEFVRGVGGVPALFSLVMCACDVVCC